MPAILVAVALGFQPGEALAVDLKPYQKAALDKILAQMDPGMRDMMRAQLEPTLSALSEEQVAMMLTAMEEQSADSETDESDEADYADEAETPTASPEDLSYNRAQYEPVMRAQWSAQKAFDDFVDARLVAECPARDTYAVYGSGWRYEVYPLEPHWNRASWNVDSDVQIIGQSYAPQDGRYEFDFSAVKRSFDQDRVAAAVKAACADYKGVGEAFMAQAKSLAATEKLDDLGKLEQQANGKRGPIAERLEQSLQAESPTGDSALFTAFLNARKIN